MSDDEVRSQTDDRRRCIFTWCTTLHGSTSHEADEDHRSDGRALTLTLRDAFDGARVSHAEIEIGLLRRRTDTRTWLVIEDGRDIAVQVSVESANELLRAVLADPAVADEFEIVAAEEVRSSR